MKRRTASLPRRVSGQMSAEQALQRLLSGSGLTFRRTDGHTMALEPLPTEGALNLGRDHHHLGDGSIHELPAATDQFGDALISLASGNPPDRQRRSRPR